MSDMTHAGGVVVRSEADDGLRVLLIRSKDGAHWVLPKGHIDPGETAREAAIREVREESGIVGEVVGELGVDAYTMEHPPRRPDNEAPSKHSKKQAKPRKEKVRVLFFLMRYGGMLPADEDRAMCWLPLDAAAAAIEFEGSRALIQKAAGLLAPEM